MLILLTLKKSVDKGFCSRGQKRSAFTQTLECKLLAKIFISVPASSSTLTSSFLITTFRLFLNDEKF